MDANGAERARVALCLALPVVSFPKPFGAAFMRGSGALSYTNSLSLPQLYFGVSLRQLGRRVSPLANIVAAGAAGYLPRPTANCAFMCNADQKSW